MIRLFCKPLGVRYLSGFPGLMQNTPLLVSSLIEYAGTHHKDVQVVSKTVEGPIHTYTYADALTRCKQLARALSRLGIGQSDRVATLAWNSYRHFELYYSVGGAGAVLHTVNPRLFPDQISYIVNHAEDKVLFTDTTFIPLVASLLPKMPTVKRVVVMTDKAHMPPSDVLKDAVCYEDLLDAETADFSWPVLDENSAAAMCYTSGTTGNPKGVVYSHRSTVLHAWAALPPDCLAISSRDTIMPVVPLFHASAWGACHCSAMAGAKLVLPGCHLDGKSLHELLNNEKVTIALGVPTIWMMLLQHMDKTNTTLPYLQRTVIGGSAVPPAMIREFEAKHNVRVLHAWGMTETSPIGSFGALKKKHDEWTKEDQFRVQCKQGRGIFGCDIRIVDDEGREVAHDGKTPGRLQVRGPWVIERYYQAEKPAVDSEGWFDTGDISTMDDDGYIQITDRSKDIIKSGGEWISSIDLENAAMGHPGVAEAAAIGLPHPKWDERPLLVIIKKTPETTKESVFEFLKPRIAHWWLPDDIVFVDSLPHTATGKLLKTKIREMFANYTLPAKH